MCEDVRIEPELLPVEIVSVDGNRAEKTRLDFSPRGVWNATRYPFLMLKPPTQQHLLAKGSL